MSQFKTHFFIHFYLEHNSKTKIEGNMYQCECKRKFTTPQGLGKHKKKCGNIGIDNGYEYRLDRNGNRVYIHREVMEKKLGRKLKIGELVHHIDGIKRNNSPDNLSLTNHSLHAFHHYNSSLHDHQVKGIDVATSKLTERQVLEIKRKLTEGAKIANIARSYDVDWTTIGAIRDGRTWKHIAE